MPSDDERGRSRRAVLRRGVAALTASVTAAGCLSNSPLSSGVSYGTVDPPAPTGTPATEWLPAPAAFAGDAETYDVFDVTPGAVRVDGTRWTFPESVMAVRLDHFGTDYEEYGRAVGAGPATVVEFSPDRSAVAALLSDTGYASAGQYRGYDRYDRPDVPRTVAVGPEAVVMARGPDGGADVRAVIDARNGDRRRYAEADPDYARVAAAAGGGPYTWIRDEGSHEPDGFERSYTAESFRLGDGGVYAVERWLYDSGTEPTVDHVREVLAGRGRPGRAEAVEVSVDGRLATVEMRLGTDVVDLYTRDGDPVDWPVVTWGFGFDPETKTVSITHEAGPVIDANYLQLYFVEDTGSPNNDTVADDHDVVGPGDTISLDVATEGVRVRLAYEAHTDLSVTLFDHVFPGALGD